jgi:hypothetical protein
LLATEVFVNIFSRFVHFIDAFLRVQLWKWRGYEVLADPARQGIRFLYCQHCDAYKDGMCVDCGCLVQAKISLNSEECPRKYWPREKVKKNSDS